MIVLIRGGGDLASGVALRLHHVGLRVVISELPQPLAVRRLACFSEAVYQGKTVVEGVMARRADAEDALRVLQLLSKGRIPVIVDPEGKSALSLYPTVIIDARMTKRPPEPMRHNAKLYIGLGPGFTAGNNCHAVIETQRGHKLGRVIWQGEAQQDTGTPQSVADRGDERVLRAPAEGSLQPHAAIGDSLDAGQLIAEVAGQPVISPFRGILRGLLHPDVPVYPGLKIGDVDPHMDTSLCNLVSDKALAVGGGVLEAMLSRSELRSNFWA
jgi:xanthine dehydrogenase accessory factor